MCGTCVLVSPTIRHYELRALSRRINSWWLLFHCAIEPLGKDIRKLHTNKQTDTLRKHSDLTKTSAFCPLCLSLLSLWCYFSFEEVYNKNFILLNLFNLLLTWILSLTLNLFVIIFACLLISSCFDFLDYCLLFLVCFTFFIQCFVCAVSRIHNIYTTYYLCYHCFYHDLTSQLPPSLLLRTILLQIAAPSLFILLLRGFTTCTLLYLCLSFNTRSSSLPSTVPFFFYYVFFFFLLLTQSSLHFSIGSLFTCLFLLFLLTFLTLFHHFLVLFLLLLLLLVLLRFFQ